MGMIHPIAEHKDTRSILRTPGVDVNILNGSILNRAMKLAATCDDCDAGWPTS
jgi:hypothetical protein